jgi:hypothetical protein
LAIEATERKTKADRDQDSTAKRERERERKEDKKIGKCRLMRDNTSKNEKNEGAMGGDLVLCLYLVLLLLASSAAA